jgi:hypothetical protein
MFLIYQFTQRSSSIYFHLLKHLQSQDGTFSLFTTYDDPPVRGFNIHGIQHPAAVSWLFTIYDDSTVK